jgi:hypothetical protein
MDNITESTNTKKMPDERELIFSGNFEDNIDGLLSVARYKHTDEETMKQVMVLIKEHKNKFVRDLFGFCVADYAIATLYRLNTDESMAAYNELVDGMRETAREKIEVLARKDWFD